MSMSEVQEEARLFLHGRACVRRLFDQSGRPFFTPPLLAVTLHIPGDGPLIWGLGLFTPPLTWR